MDRLVPAAPYRRPELLALGYTDADLRTLRSRGHLTSLRRGCYLAGPAPQEPAERHRIQARAALALLTTPATLCHASAAVLHGLPTWRIPLRRAHIVRAQSSGGRLHQQVHMWTASLTPGEIVLVDGLPVTSVARTVVDLARSVSFESALAAADAALARRLVTRTELDDALVRAKGWRGCPRARGVVAFADGRAESVGESRSRLAIARAGLLAPVLQWEVRGEDGRVVGRTDFGWPAQRVGGEFDGRTKYGRLLRPGQDPGDAVFDEKLREDELRAEGVAIVRWTWPDLANFASTATRLRRALTTPDTRTFDTTPKF
jgi:hypothetical protein